MTEEIGEVLPGRFRELKPKLKMVLWRFGVDPGDEEDVLQEVMLAAVEQWGKIRQLEPFLIAVARNRCRHWIRRHLRQKSFLSPLDAGVAEPVIESNQKAVERRRDLLKLVAVLKPRQRKALSLRGQGYTHKEIGAALGIRPLGGRQVFESALRRIERRVSGARRTSRQRGRRAGS